MGFKERWNLYNMEGFYGGAIWGFLGFLIGVVVVFTFTSSEMLAGMITPAISMLFDMILNTFIPLITPWGTTIGGTTEAIMTSIQSYALYIFVPIAVAIVILSLVLAIKKPEEIHADQKD